MRKKFASWTFIFLFTGFYSRNRSSHRHSLLGLFNTIILVMEQKDTGPLLAEEKLHLDKLHSQFFNDYF